MCVAAYVFVLHGSATIDPYKIGIFFVRRTFHTNRVEEHTGFGRRDGEKSKKNSDCRHILSARKLCGHVQRKRFEA